MGFIFLILITLALGYVFFPYLSLAYVFAFPDYSRVESENGAVNILVLGKGGEGHEAPDLTDTIMLVVLDRGRNRISLLPLPRDIWVSEIRAKLNSAYFWGKQKNEGFKLVDDAVKKITNRNVDYHLVADFSLFKGVIDALGGVEVDVQNSFTDSKYPIEGRENDLCNGDKTFACRYETLRFEKGIQTMDGETALKFVRSRNAEGTEGTDIARASRQEKVIESIQRKITSPRFYLNPWSISKVLSEVMENLEMDFNVKTAVILGRIAFDSRNNLAGLSIPEDLFEVSNKLPRYDFQYVFIPKVGNFSGIHEWIEKSLSL